MCVIHSYNDSTTVRTFLYITNWCDSENWLDTPWIKRNNGQNLKTKLVCEYAYLFAFVEKSRVRNVGKLVVYSWVVTQSVLRAISQRLNDISNSP